MSARGLVPFIFFVAAISGCGRLDSIDYSPKIAPEEFLRSQPHWHLKFPPVDLVLIQPSSTVMVYAAALLTMGAGLRFLRVRDRQRTRLWWGVGLLLTGFGALLAGTSYQAFGYEIKCAGRAFCTWTSWWEVAYLLFTGAGMNAMLAAVAFSCTAGRLRKVLCACAAACGAVYAGVVLAGALFPVRFLVSFECLMLAGAPPVALALFLTSRAYHTRRDRMSHALLRVWGLFVMVMAAYIGALAGGMAETLWARGIWFTENDVLHLGMILWVLYVAAALPKAVEDLRGPATASGP